MVMSKGIEVGWMIYSNILIFFGHARINVRHVSMPKATVVFLSFVSGAVTQSNYQIKHIDLTGTPICTSRSISRDLNL